MYPFVYPGLKNSGRSFNKETYPMLNTVFSETYLNIGLCFVLEHKTCYHPVKNALRNVLIKD